MSQPAPTIIGFQTYPLVHSITGGRPGPYQNGSDLWIIASEIPSGQPGANVNLVAYKRVGGAPYARIAAGPACSQAVLIGTSNGPAQAYVSWLGTGTVLDIGYQDPNGVLWAITFDMATGLFGTPTSTGITGSLNYGFYIRMIRLGGPNLAMVYNDVPGFVWAVGFDGSTWDTPVQVSPGVDASLSRIPGWIVRDSSGNAGILEFETISGNATYTTFNGTSLVAQQSISSAVFANPVFNRRLGAAYLDPISDSSVFPLIYYTFGPTQVNFGLVVGTPSATPTFSLVHVMTMGPNDDNPDSLQITGNAAGNLFTLFWSQINHAARIKVINTSTATTLGGSWSAPSLYYSQNANPPTPAPVSAQMMPVYSITVGASTISAIVGIEVTTPNVWVETLYTFLGAVPPPPGTATITAIKTVTGGTAVPSDWTVTATGLDSQSGAGGFGPVTVRAGVYTLSESGPPGYTQLPWTLTGTGTLVGNKLTLAAGDVAVIGVTNEHGTRALSVACLPPTYVIGAPYDQFFIAIGGVPPYTFSIIAGALSAGLTLNPSTGEVTGTPTDPSMSYTVKVTDSA